MPEKIDHRPTFARIEELNAAGDSFRRIAEILQSEGFPPIGRRKEWSHHAVAWCLNERGRRSAKTPPSPPVSAPKPPSGPPPPPQPAPTADPAPPSDPSPSPQTAPTAEPPPPTAPAAAPKPTPKADAIDVHGPYTVEDRRLHSLLLRLATPDLDPGAIHQMSVSSVLDALGLDQEQLTAALDRLICTSMKWVCLRPPGLIVWAPLLASATLSGNFLSFHFAPPLIKLLRIDKEYGRIQAVLEKKENKAPPQAFVFPS